jgi:predicted  nucleic acid-binding Zn-ribbon protein
VDRPRRERPLNADPVDQLRLLEVQARDIRLGQLAHRAATLPDAVRLADLLARRSRCADEIVAAEVILDDLLRDQAKAEADVEQVRERARRDRALLDGGTIGDPKQLQSIEAELTSLARRQSDLEDVELEVMERVEGARAAVTVLTAEREALDVDVAAVQASVADQEAVIEAERVVVAAERAELAAGLPDDLLALYERIRADQGGVGAARLHRGRCDGCHLDLPPTDIEAIRAAAPQQVLRCEECRRILVRTPESGL